MPLLRLCTLPSNNELSAAKAHSQHDYHHVLIISSVVHNNIGVNPAGAGGKVNQFSGRGDDSAFVPPLFWSSRSAGFYGVGIELSSAPLVS